MPELTVSPVLADLQQYVAKMERERGFAEQSVKDKCLLLGEEIGELFKAVRKAEGLAVDPQSQVADIGDELADILIYVCAIANRYHVQLEAAFRHKESLNQQRTWLTPAHNKGKDHD